MRMLDLILLLAGLMGAAAVAAGCAMVFVVWLAGGRRGDDVTEAWRPADKA